LVTIMLIPSEKDIRASFVNASRKEVSDLTLPAGFAQLNGETLDYLGWRDPKLARRAYVVIPTADGLVGVLLRQAEATARQRAQCSWCQDITLPNPVVFYSAKRGGAAGRNGDTVGTLICEDFECSANVRSAPPVAYLGFDVDAAKLDRIEALRQHSAGFADVVVKGGSVARA
jgi:hypothetical protein